MTILVTLAAAAAVTCAPLDPAGLDKLAEAKGGRVKVVFFSSWCASCKQHLTETHDDKTVLVGAFDEKERLEAVLAALKVTTPCHFDEGVTEALGVKALPKVVDYQAKALKEPRGRS